MTNIKNSDNISTRCVNFGRTASEQFGFVNTPIYRGSTVLAPTVDSLLNRDGRYTYATKGTPTIRALEEAWTQLTGAHGSVITPSGLSACGLALMSCLKSGDHLLMCDSVYWPTRHFCDDVLKRMGIQTTYYSPMMGASIESLIQKNTTVIFTESPGSLTFEVQDIPAISNVAHKHNAIIILDNTWATPLFFSAHEKGADIVVDAGTKYLGGHSDLLLGQVSANEKTWGSLRRTFDAFAMCAGPEDVFLALRGLRTMPMRVNEAQKQGLLMAKWLKGRPEVAQVLHPALPDCVGHEIWKRDFTGSTGLFSVVLNAYSMDAVAAMLNGLRLFGMGYSWGGFESLVIPFDASYRKHEDWHVKQPCLRFQIGFEDVSDLQSDLEEGFERLNQFPQAIVEA